MSTKVKTQTQEFKFVSEREAGQHGACRKQSMKNKGNGGWMTFTQNAKSSENDWVVVVDTFL